MLSQTTKLKGVKLIKEQYTNELHEWRMETYSWIKYNGLGIKTLFTVDYETTVKFKNTLRGLYFQNNPLQQALLIRCVQGEILQAVVDLRSTSKQYGQWSLFHLRGEDLNSIYIPGGFAQGFLTLTDDVRIHYKADQPCSSDFEKVLNYADPTIGIDWPTDEKFIISVKDETAPFLDELDCNYL